MSKVRMHLPDDRWDTSVAAAVGKSLWATMPDGRKSVPLRLPESRSSTGRKRKNTCLVVLHKDQQGGSIAVFWTGKHTPQVRVVGFAGTVGVGFTVDSARFRVASSVYVSSRAAEARTDLEAAVIALTHYPLRFARRAVQDLLIPSYIRLVVRDAQTGRYARLERVERVSAFLREVEEWVDGKVVRTPHVFCYAVAFYNVPDPRVRIEYQIDLTAAYKTLDRVVSQEVPIDAPASLRRLEWDHLGSRMVADLSAAHAQFVTQGLTQRTYAISAQAPTGTALVSVTIERASSTTVRYSASPFKASYTTKYTDINGSSLDVLRSVEVLAAAAVETGRYSEGTITTIAGQTQHSGENGFVYNPGTLESIGSSWSSTTTIYPSVSRAPATLELPTATDTIVYARVSEFLPGGGSAYSYGTESGRYTNGFARPIDSSSSSESSQQYGVSLDISISSIGRSGNKHTIPLPSTSPRVVTNQASSHSTGIPAEEGTTGFHGSITTSSSSHSDTGATTVVTAMADDGATLVALGATAFAPSASSGAPITRADDRIDNDEPVLDTFGVVIDVVDGAVKVGGTKHTPYMVAGAGAKYWGAPSLVLTSQTSSSASQVVGRESYYGGGSNYSGAISADSTSSSTSTYAVRPNTPIARDYSGMQVVRQNINGGIESVSYARIVVLAAPKSLVGKGDNVYSAVVHNGLRLLVSAMRSPSYADLPDLKSSAGALRNQLQNSAVQADEFGRLLPACNEFIAACDAGDKGRIERAFETMVGACFRNEVGSMLPADLETRLMFGVESSSYGVVFYYVA